MIRSDDGRVADTERCDATRCGAVAALDKLVRKNGGNARNEHRQAYLIYNLTIRDHAYRSDDESGRESGGVWGYFRGEVGR